MILRPFRRSPNAHSIACLYGAIVARARLPAFYLEFGVPDTIEGRFDMLVLHLVLVLRRLARAGDRGRAFGQQLFDAFCRDLDGNLREMGVGDLTVPKRMRGFGEAFYGRQAAYLAALEADDPAEFENALSRNILQAEGIDHRAAGLARYARAAARQLDAQVDAALFGGALDFPHPRLLRMRQHRRDQPETPWHAVVAVAEIAESGAHMALVADAETRAGIARIAGLRDLPRLEASFDLSPHNGGGLRLSGRVSATVGQTCVVTLEPLTNEVEEEIDLLYMPPAAAAASEDKPEGEAEPKWDEPEPLIGGAIDLGAIATEFLLLGIDPYPRKPGAVFEPPRDSRPEAGPFARLAGLMKTRDGS